MPRLRSVIAVVSMFPAARLRLRLSSSTAAASSASPPKPHVESHQRQRVGHLRGIAYLAPECDARLVYARALRWSPCLLASTPTKCRARARGREIPRDATPRMPGPPDRPQ